MTDIPEDDLEETRAALAPMLEATAAILPWVDKPRTPRFDPQLNARWIEAAKQLADAWSERHRHGFDPLRAAIFKLYAVAIETADGDCLGLGEALASAGDRLDTGEPTPRLVAALSGTIETLSDPAGLEHAAFSERARHFAGRLASSADPAESGERSTVLDHLFVQEAQEHLDLLRDAMAALPPDAYTLTVESNALAQQAEIAELWGVMHLARQIAGYVRGHLAELDQPACRAALDEQLRQLGAAIAAIEP